MKTPVLLLLTLLAVFTSACSQESKPGDAAVKDPETITAPVFQERLNMSRDAQVLDVRTPEEFNGGHLSNAVNINIYDADFMDRAGKLDKSKPVFVYCLGGGRSAEAAARLSAAGFQDVYNLKGGITAWRNADLPLEGAPQQTVAGDSFTPSDLQLAIQQFPALVIDYYAPWCGPCKRMEPSIATLTKEFAGKVKILRVNTDEARQLTRVLGIESIPSFGVYKNGREIQRVVGYQTEEQLREIVKSTL
jgi:thioredoxin